MAIMTNLSIMLRSPLVILFLCSCNAMSSDLSLFLDDTTTTTTTTSTTKTKIITTISTTIPTTAATTKVATTPISNFFYSPSKSSVVGGGGGGGGGGGSFTSPILFASPVSAPTTTLVPHPPPAVKSSAKFFNKSTPKKRKIADVSSLRFEDDITEWRCPNITGSRSLECGCDLPHTLRCNGDLHGLTVLAESLRTSPYSISLLDCSLRNVTFLSDAKIFDGISLHGLVISSGEIKRVHKSAFLGIKGPLQALGLPSNALLSVPWNSISTLIGLERLDLSNNKIKALGTTDLAGLTNLVFLELSNNHISSISQRTFANLRKLEVLKLAGNRLGDYPSSLKSLTQCYNLRQLDLTANNLNGPLSAATLPGLRSLETLELNRNLIKSIQNKALQNFSRLSSLSLRHNQIDVLQDHAFYGLGALESLDLSYNGIVAISSASLQHLTRLQTLDLTHNFLRALTSDLIVPLPSLRELRLAGNDISIVAKNALDGAKELKSLSLQDNPLSCDCTMRPFAEWLQVAKIQAQDLISPTCVTPPRLEGAPLIQVPVESLNCDMDNVEKDNANILEHLETFSRHNESVPPHIKDYSEEIILHELHYSADYGLILTWILNLSKNDYMCDAIFVYKEENVDEILIDNSPIHCESKIINGQNTVSVIVPDSSSLDIGESYRFCLVMVQEKNPKSDLNIGCSNITKLQLSHPAAVPQIRQHQRGPATYADSTSFDRFPATRDGGSSVSTAYTGIGTQTNRKFADLLEHQQQASPAAAVSAAAAEAASAASAATTPPHHASFNFLDSLNRSFLPGLGLGILVTSIVVLIWGAARLRQNVQHGSRRSRSSSSSNATSHSNNNNCSRPGTPTATTCYAASEHIARLTDAESGTRYLKLQATTSL